jgi:putative membrane protein insertion efficiency factor
MAIAFPTANENADSAPDLRQRLLGFVFRIYKSVLSPVLHAVAPSRCLYVPTCSEYAYIAMSRFGIARGSWMALRRFARCHPWGKGGLDPVAECSSNSPQGNTGGAQSRSDSISSDRLS